MVVIKPTTDFNYVAITYLSGAVFLGFLLTGPLQKLTKTRPAIMMICSKCIATVLDLPISVLGMPVLAMPQWSYLQLPLTIVVRLHVLALALNRAHSVLLPFHYNKNGVNRRYMLNLCLLCWLIAFCIGCGGIAIGCILQPGNPMAIAQSVKFYHNLVVAASGAIIYVCLAVRIIWALSSRTTSTLNPHEKDHIRLFFVCFIGVLPFIGSYIQKFSFLDPSAPDWIESLVNIVGAICDSLSFVTEEICLIFICAELRRLLRNHFRRILGIFVKMDDESTSRGGGVTAVGGAMSQRNNGGNNGTAQQTLFIITSRHGSIRSTQL